MYMVAHPQLDLIDELVRIFGWPALLGALVWLVRKWDKSQEEFKHVSANTTAAVSGIDIVKQRLDVLENNHLAHLQMGIDRVAISNDKAVEALTEMNTSIKILVDRTPRA
jgi:GTP-sensing pleiotropic transcriptional regulator CodY